MKNSRDRIFWFLDDDEGVLVYSPAVNIDWPIGSYHDDLISCKKDTWQKLPTGTIIELKQTNQDFPALYKDKESAEIILFTDKECWCNC